MFVEVYFLTHGYISLTEDTALLRSY